MHMGTMRNAGDQPSLAKRPFIFVADILTGKAFRRNGKPGEPRANDRPALHNVQMAEVSAPFVFVFDPARIVWEMLKSPKEERSRLIEEVERNARGIANKYLSLERMLHELDSYVSSGKAKAEGCEENAPHARHLIEKHMLRILITTTMESRSAILSSLSREQLTLLKELISGRPHTAIEDPADAREYSNILLQIGSEFQILDMKEAGIFTQPQRDENGRIKPWNPHPGAKKTE